MVFAEKVNNNSENACWDNYRQAFFTFGGVL